MVNVSFYILDPERRAESGRPHRVFSVSWTGGPSHHGHGPPPSLPQLFPEDPACFVGTGRPFAPSLETLHFYNGKKIRMLTSDCLAVSLKFNVIIS